MHFLKGFGPKGRLHRGELPGVRGGRVPLWSPSLGGLRMAIPGHKLLAEVRKLPVLSAMGCCETAFSGRFLYGTGESISMWAVLGVAVSQYPDRVATLIGAYGTFFGLGYLGGPVVGSLLYSVGGLALPFELVGAAGFLVTLLAMYSIPSTSKSMEEEEEDEVDEKTSEQEQTKSLTMLSTITVGQINYFPEKKQKKTFLSLPVSLHILPSPGQLCSPERVRLRRGHVRASRHRRGGDVLAGGRALLPGHLSNLRRTHAGSGTREQGPNACISSCSCC